MKKKSDEEKKAIADHFFISELGAEPLKPEKKETPEEPPKETVITPSMTLEEIEDEMGEIGKISEKTNPNDNPEEAQQRIDRFFYLSELKNQLTKGE